MATINSFPIETKRITELDPNTSLEDSDLFVTVNGGVDKNISGLVLKDEMAQVFDSLNLITSTSLADADATLTAAQLIGGEFTIASTTERTLTTDTAANIIAAMSGNVNGSNFDVTIFNTREYAVSLALGAGVTSQGDMQVSGGTGTFRFVRTTGSALVVTRLEAREGLQIKGADFDLDNALSGTTIATTGVNSSAAANNWPDVGGSSPVWWNVETTGTSSRLSQTARQVFTSGSSVPSVFYRAQQGVIWSPWIRLDNTSASAIEVKSLYESNSNTNEFSDAEQAKLTGIEAGAQVNNPLAQARFSVGSYYYGQPTTNSGFTVNSGGTLPGSYYGTSGTWRNMSTNICRVQSISGDIVKTINLIHRIA